MAELTKSQKIIFLVFGVIILIVVLMALGILPGLKSNQQKKSPPMPPMTLEFWGIDNEDYFKPLIEKFIAIYPNVTIRYKKINETEYETKLIDALASQSGPDILMIKNNWIPKHINKLYPSTVTLKDLKNAFVDVVASDLYYNNDSQGRVWALPLWVDTLALFYNKDLFNNASIALPPQNWDEFIKDVQLLTKKDTVGSIFQSGVALGTVNNISYPTEILLTLIMQNGQQLVDESGRAIFNNPKAQDAINFYLSFANPVAPNYCWNASFGNDIELFAQNKVAMIIAYSSAMKKIEGLNPYLNYSVSFLPQPTNAKLKQNLANYWALSVSATSRYPQMAWNFIYYIINNGMKDYMDLTQRPTPMRTLISECQKYDKLSVFCEQSLVAKSWLQFNPEKNTQILKNMLESIISGRSSVGVALSQAVDLINK
ncbi:MAG: extracellular solute-binding protein [Patescibacteria group bacterium]|jgi:multiple sugar transport system substrate-binding protein|nr:extracellular solute-binding protein [Patescibacteria group bacterium]